MQEKFVILFSKFIHLLSLGFLLGWMDNLFSYLRHKPGEKGWFCHGWGEVERELLEWHEEPKGLDVEWENEWEEDSFYMWRNGKFLSPVSHLLPAESKTAYFQMILPKHCPKVTQTFPIVIQLAATGDEGFQMRKKIALALVRRKGIGSLILENPYYGLRKPIGQFKGSLRKVVDVMKVTRAAIEESRSLLTWLRECTVYKGQLGITGMSMGGAFSITVGMMTPFPIACVPCMSPHSAVPVLSEGVMSKVINWDILMEQSELPLKEVKGKLEGFLNPFCSTPSYLVYHKHPISVVSVSAKHDKFIPFHSTLKVHHTLNQLKSYHVEHRWIGGGHVSGFLLHQRTSFVEAIIHAFEKLEAVEISNLESSDVYLIRRR